MMRTFMLLAAAAAFLFLDNVGASAAATTSHHDQLVETSLGLTSSQAGAADETETLLAGCPYGGPSRYYRGPSVYYRPVYPSYRPAYYPGYYPGYYPSVRTRSYYGPRVSIGFGF